jgi:vancomycin resistance protein VanW
VSSKLGGGVWIAGIGLAATGGALLALQPAGEPRLAQYATSLEGRTPNQRHNALLAARHLDGTVVRPGETLSFNQAVGSWSRDVGYRKAPVSYNGQLVPSWGGGVCQTSTTLYNAALLAGMALVERHPHRIVTGYCPPGLDAAVAFSGIDLKLRNPHAFPLRIEAKADRGSLVVSIYGRRRLPQSPLLVTEVRQAQRPATFAAGGASAWGEAARLPDGARNRPGGARVRNEGKAGCEVASYRVTGNRKELLSVDRYPVVHRVVEMRPFSDGE